MTKANLSFTNSTHEDINLMPVSYEYFAEYASLYGRAYGMLTGEARGITGPDEQTLESFVANDCIRNALYQGLLRVSREAEARIGYKLSTRYLTVEPVWRGAGKMPLKLPGVEAVEVARNWYPIAEDNLIPLNYYTEEDLTLFLDGSVVIARISEDLFENPTFAYLKNETDSNRRLFIDKGHARYAERDSGDWLLPILTNITAADVTDTVHAYHQRHLDVTVTKPDVSALPEGGSIQPVYLGSNQIIAHEVLSEDDTTIVYRFPIWTLVAPPFRDETIEWEAFPVWKMYQEIELRYVVEEAAYATLIWSEGDDQYTYQYDPDADDADNLPRLKVNLVDNERGIVHLYANDQLLRDLTPYWWRACGNKRQKMPESMVVRIPIKVTVDWLPNHLRDQVDLIREAIIAKVAAELPVEDCGCKNKIGFVFEQQKAYGNAYMNPFTGVEVVKTDKGQRHGELVYAETLRSVHIYRKPVRVGGN